MGARRLSCGVAWNIADLIEHTVDAVPDRVALIAGDRSETCAQLEDRANRLAHHLARTASVPATTSASTGSTAWSSSRRSSPPTSCERSRSTSITGTWKPSCATCSTTPIWSRSSTTRSSRPHRDRPRIAAAVAPPDRHRRRLRHRLLGHRLGAVRRRPRRRVTGARLRARSEDDIYILYTGGTTGMPSVVWRQEDVIRVGWRHQLRHRREDRGRSPLRRAGGRRGEGQRHRDRAAHARRAQWGTFGSLFNGKTLVLMPKFDATRCGRRSRSIASPD